MKMKFLTSWSFGGVAAWLLMFSPHVAVAQNQAGLAVAGPQGTPAADPALLFCVQAFPDELQSRIELNERTLREAVGPNGVGDLAPEFVIERLKLWRTEQTVTVAFLAGSYELRKSIMEVASAWVEKEGCNLKLDFGHDSQRRTFREWSFEDGEYAADIRIGFHHAGYWSLVGNDSRNPSIVDPKTASMNFGGFLTNLPDGWDGTVLHEFGHALGFHHEHQHPTGGCDDQFKWADDPGYTPTRDGFGQYIADRDGRRPGIYTVLGGPPNKWPKHKVDFNLKQLPFSTRFQLSEFDPKSIMKYSFPQWMFISGDRFHCFNVEKNVKLSKTDLEGARTAYPRRSDEGFQGIVGTHMETLSLVEQLVPPGSQQKKFLKGQYEDAKDGLEKRAAEER